MNNKFVNIKVDGQEEIGVIDLGVITHGLADTEKCNLIKSRLEPKMVEALAAHFNCEIRVISVNVIDSVGAIEVVAHVIVGAEEEDYQEEVTMSETWVY